MVDDPALRAQATVHPDATLAAHGVRWEARREVRVRAPTMSRAVQRLGSARKPRP